MPSSRVAILDGDFDVEFDQEVRAGSYIEVLAVGSVDATVIVGFPAPTTARTFQVEIPADSTVATNARLIAEIATQLDDVSYGGLLHFETEKRQVRARKDAINTGPVAKLIEVMSPTTLAVRGRGPVLTPETPTEAALDLLARRAMGGWLRCRLWAQGVELMISAKSRTWREVRPAALGPGPSPIEQIRHPSTIRKIALSPRFIATGGLSTTFRSSLADAPCVRKVAASKNLELGRG